ncbi:Cas4 family exonuclease [Arthrobacter phage Mufasa8]|uniref:Cas4 family exonuclease n=1 Tax=Arthrobacter phage Mufasa8 TaxID=2656526 RepID=A0A649VN44_9CAUD|nr:Cas4 family exonuclease [Arthrobacter phage Mufasa8]QGJ93495.1 Cas4 family exonuclease [Arthrobacter phage Mufasa8]
MSLTFDPEKHRYTLDGKRVRGVTSLINGGTSKDQLVRWAPRFVAQFVQDNFDKVMHWHSDPAVDMVKRLQYLPENYRDEAGVRGTAIHDAVEQTLLTGEAEVDEVHLPEVNALLDLYDQWEIEPLQMTLKDGSTTLMVEKSVANRTYWYAGRFDLIGRVGKLGGAICQIDTKSSNGVYGSMSMQLAAYRKAEFWVNDDDPDTEYPMPVIERHLIAHVKRTKSLTEGEPDVVAAGLQAVSGGYPYSKAQSIKDMDEAFREFLWAASLTKTAGARDKRLWPVDATTNTFKEIAS